MKRTKEDLLFIKRVAEDNLAGGYDPAKLTRAVKLITGSDELMHIRNKKQKVMGFFNYTLQKELKGFDKTELAVDPPTITGVTHTEGELLVENGNDLNPTKVEDITSEKNDPNLNRTVDNPTKTEEVKMEKPKAKRKKRVTRPKNHKSNLNLEA